MRTIEDIEKDIEQTREHLHQLYAEQNEFNKTEIDCEKGKFYLFKDPDDESIEYCGKLIDYGYEKYDNEYWFNVCGIQKCFSEYQDSCWSGFDALYVIYVKAEKLEKFLDNFVEITQEEFEKNFDKWVIDTRKWMKYFIN